MADVKTAIRRAMNGGDSRGPSFRDILSVNASGTTLKNPILDFTGWCRTVNYSKKTRLTFTWKKIINEIETFDVGRSCHDILTTQRASQSGLYLVHPPNIVQGPWRVYCDQESNGGGWTVKTLL